MDKTSAELIPNWHFTSYSFDDINLENQLLRNIYGYGMGRPSDIQTGAITAISKRKDVIAKSPPMSGKTMGYCIALLHLKFLYPEIRKGQALIISHNEDHVRYTHKILLDLGEKLKVDARICMQVSDDVEKEVESVQEHFQIIVATPGTACNMVKKGYLKMNEVQIIVIDDVDKMIEQGVLENVEKIISSADKGTQKAMFSSIITPEIISLSERFLEDPARIVVSDDDITLVGLKQYYVDVEKEEWKKETLKEIYDNVDIVQCGVYCSTIQRVLELEAWMKDKGTPVTCIHENMERIQQEQNRTLWRFGDYRILISTGVVSIRHEFASVDATFLYDPPENKEQYLRLIGRRGRYGKRGVAIILATKDDMDSLKEIENISLLKPVDFPSIYD